MRIREATLADGPRLLALARATPMAGALSYCLEREPDFFALTRLQGDEAHVWVAEAGDELVGMGTGIVSRLHVGGRARRAIYLADLKVSPRHRQQGIASRLYQVAYEGAARLGAELTYGLVLGGNRVMDSLHRRLPASIAARRIATVRSHSLFLGGRARPAPAPSPSDVRTRRAVAGDLDAMAALWRRVHAARDLVPALGDATRLGARLALPGGIRVEDFLVVERGGAITGFAAVWDPAAVRQVRIVSVGRALAALRGAYNPAARLLGRPRMPDDGGLLRSLYLTYPCVESSHDFEALVESARDAHRAGGALFLEAALDVRDPLAPVLARRFALRVDYHVVAFGWDGAPPAACAQPVYLDLGLA
jgi:GNAT superfamily N-acetyltransferase